MPTFEITQDGQTFEINVEPGVDPNEALAQFTGTPAAAEPLGDAATIPQQIKRGVGLGLRTAAFAPAKAVTGIADLVATGLNVPVAGVDKLGQFFGAEPFDARFPTGSTALLNERLDRFLPAPETLGEKIIAGTGEVALTGGVGGAALAPKAGQVARNPAAQSVIRNLGDEIGELFAKSPKTFAALETTAGAGAVGAGELAGEAGLSPAQRFLVTLLGGGAGAITPQLAVTQGRRLVTGAKNLFTKAGSEVRAARELQGAAAEPTVAARAAAEAPEGVLPARATQDPKLQAIESKVLADDPQLAAKVAADLEAAETRTLTELADQFGPGTTKQDFQHSVIERGAAPGTKIKLSQPDEMLDDAAISFNKAYTEAEGFPVQTAGVREELTLAAADKKIIADKDWRKGIKSFLTSIFDDVAKRGDLTSTDFLALRQTVRKELRRRTKSGQTDARAAAEADMLNNANKVLTGVLEEQLPAQASTALRATDARYADFVAVQGAVLRSGEKGLTPEALRASVKATAVSPGQFARGKGGDLARLAEQGKDVAAVLGKPDQAGRIVRDMTPEQLQATKANFNQAVAAKATGTKGRLLGDKYLQQIEKNRETLKAAGFTDTEISNMQVIGKELKMIQARSPAAVQELLNDNPGRLVRLMAAIVGSRAGTRALKLFGGTTGAGPSLILARFGSVEMQKMVAKLSIADADKILREAATNKKLFAALMTRPTDSLKKQAQAARTMQAFLLEPAKQASEIEDE